MITKVIMKPEVLATASKGATVEEIPELAKGRVVLSNEAVDKLLISGDSGERKKIVNGNALPCWTGTMAANEAPDKALGKTVEWEAGGLTWVFPVPEKFHGEVNAVLSVDHPHWDVKKEGNRRIIIVDDETNVKLTKDFPAKDGLYGTDANKIPCGKVVDSDSPDARHLWRFNGPRVSLVAREFNVYYGWLDVYLGVRPYDRLGVVAEGVADEAGTPEKTADLKMTREADGRLVIEGPKEALDAFVKEQKLE